MADDLTVVTGTYGIMELEDERKIPRKLYLNYQKNVIPVPLYFWKVVYHPKTKQGISLITSNNPYLAKNTKLPFCKDICFDKGWANANITGEFAIAGKGLTVCCTYSELRKAVPHVPFLEVQDILRGPHF